MKTSTLNENALKEYPTRGQIKVRDKIVDIPSKYRGEAITALFPISFDKASKVINSNQITPAKLSPNKSVLSVTIFNFRASPVGPYTEIAYAIPVFYKPKLNFPFIPLLLHKFFRNFGFFVIDIAQSTEIAIEHGNLLTGYPHNQNLINVEFIHDEKTLCVKVVDESREVLTINATKPEGEKDVQQTYMTYFEKNNELFKIQMDIYGIEKKINRCDLHLGKHKLSEVINHLDVSLKSLQTRYYPDVTEVNPVTLECI